MMDGIGEGSLIFIIYTLQIFHAYITAHVFKTKATTGGYPF